MNGCRLPYLLLLVPLASCTMPQPDRPAAEPVPPRIASQLPGAHWQDASGTAFVLDADSWITIRVYRDGRLARFGHNHVIEVDGLQARLKLLDTGAAVALLQFRADRLRVDDPQARARAGEGFDQIPDAKSVDGTRRNMLGADVLDAGTWPEIGVAARIDNLDAAAPEAQIDLSLRGIGRRYSVPVVIAREGLDVTVSGSLSLSQKALGMTPFSILGGALRVHDRVDVEFRISGRKSKPTL